MRAAMGQFALIFSFLAALGFAQQVDPIANMCFRFDHQSTIKNNVLYIDGGKESFIDVDRHANQTGNITIGYNTYVLEIDLSKSWDWNKNISEVVVNKPPQPNTGIFPPVLSRGALYQSTNDDKNIYLWGGTTSYTNTSFPGFRPPDPARYALWSFNTISKEWNHFDISNASPNRPSSASSAEAPDQGLAFFLSGELDSGSSVETQVLGDSDKVFIEGMIVIDTTNQSAKNISTSALFGDMPRSRGRMQYIPGIGERGILVQIGGNQKPVNETDNTYIGNLLPMDELDIFDIASLYNTSTPDGAWYKQKAMGDIPDGRVDSCLALASAPDNSSHNIYMYGGRGANSAYFDDIHVLSIPSFTWTKVFEGTNPRFSHTCHRVGTRTMLSVGGTRTYKYTEAPCDFERKGVNVLDMSTITWGSAYNVTTGPYNVPPAIVAKIGGSHSGNATQKSPVAGFSSPSLAAMFNMPFPTSPNPSPPRRTISRAAILGGSIGGSVALLTLSALAIYFLRDRLRRFAHGTPEPRPEMENTQRRVANEMENTQRRVANEIENTQQRVANEIMDKEVFWELDAGAEEEPAIAKRHCSAPRELSADSIQSTTKVATMESRINKKAGEINPRADEEGYFARSIGDFHNHNHNHNKSDNNNNNNSNNNSNGNNTPASTPGAGSSMCGTTVVDSPVCGGGGGVGGVASEEEQGGRGPGRRPGRRPEMGYELDASMEGGWF